jgi:hypothetical protein
MITLFTTRLVMRIAGIARSGVTAGRGLSAGVLTTIAVLLAITGSASAAPGLAINLNQANWSGNVSTIAGTTAPNAYFDPQSIVHLNGGVTQTNSASVNGSNPHLIGTLPDTGDRPNRNVYTIVHTYRGTFADLEISSQGQIFLIPSSATDTHFVSLEGITYQPYNANPVAAISLAGSNWLGNAGFGATAPGAYLTDGNSAAAVVHLQGAVTYPSSAPPITGPTLIGTIPCLLKASNGFCGESAPADRDVYEIVHTFGGSYADLEINDRGQIFLIPLTGTLTQSDTKFVSLEGISFPVLLYTGVSPNPGWESAIGFGDIGIGEDREGFIHLEGAVRQTLCCTPIATLPAWATPSRNLWFVVETNAGTFADLSIGTNGVINVIPDTLYGKPSNLSYVSLEGITYDAPSPKLFGLRVHST